MDHERWGIVACGLWKTTRVTEAMAIHTSKAVLAPAMLAALCGFICVPLWKIRQCLHT